MSRHFKVHELLSASELEELEAFAREPGRTIDECHQWLLERGFTISRTSVHRWREEFNEQRLKERLSGAGQMARALMEVASADGGSGLKLTDAAVMQLGQMIFETAAASAIDGQIDPKDLATIALALQRLTLAKSRIEDVRAEFAERQKAAVEQAAEAARTGASGETVVNKMRELLGIGTPPGVKKAGGTQ